VGIEVFHPSHTLRQVARLEALCEEYQLLMTGGSDYHGPNPETKRDDYSSLNSLHLSLNLLEPIKQAADRQRH